MTLGYPTSDMVLGCKVNVRVNSDTARGFVLYECPLVVLVNMCLFVGFLAVVYCSPSTLRSRDRLSCVTWHCHVVSLNSPPSLRISSTFRREWPSCLFLLSFSLKNRDFDVGRRGDRRWMNWLNRSRVVTCSWCETFRIVLTSVLKWALF